MIVHHSLILLVEVFTVDNEDSGHDPQYQTSPLYHIQWQHSFRAIIRVSNLAREFVNTFNLSGIPLPRIPVAGERRPIDLNHLAVRGLLDDW